MLVWISNRLRSFIPKFRKGVGGQSWGDNPSKARDSGHFSVPFSYAPLGERGRRFRHFRRFTGFEQQNPCSTFSPFSSKPPSFWRDKGTFYQRRRFWDPDFRRWASEVTGIIAISEPRHSGCDPGCHLQECSRALARKCPPKVCFLSVLGAPGSECPKECFLSVFLQFFGAEKLYSTM